MEERKIHLFGLTTANLIVVGIVGMGLLLLILNSRYRFTSLLLPISNYTPMPVVDQRIQVSGADQAEMVFIPAGKFLMGSHEEDRYAYQNEFHQHTISLDAFWIDRTEVSNYRYATCVNAGVCALPHAFGMLKLNSMTRDEYFQNLEFQDYPVVYVTWRDANTFCEWAGKRLPTEAEWEKAGRGTDGRRYPWGNKNVAGDMTNLADRHTDYDWTFRLVNDGYFDTAPVGSYPNGASPYGALDMAGNVWEWVSDWYAEDYYQVSPAVNPTGPDDGDYRGLRGGSWQSSNWGVRTALRSRLDPTLSYSYVGFRCAADEK